MRERVRLRAADASTASANEGARVFARFVAKDKIVRWQLPVGLDPGAFFLEVAFDHDLAPNLSRVVLAPERMADHGGRVPLTLERKQPVVF